MNSERNFKDGIDPEVGQHKIFFNSWDHLEHQPGNVVNDMSAIKVQQTEDIPKTGRYCRPYDFVTAHWIARQKDGTVVEDSRKFADGKPKNF